MEVEQKHSMISSAVEMRAMHQASPGGRRDFAFCLPDQEEGKVICSQKRGKGYFRPRELHVARQGNRRAYLVWGVTNTLMWLEGTVGEQVGLRRSTEANVMISRANFSGERSVNTQALGSKAFWVSGHDSGSVSRRASEADGDVSLPKPNTVRAFLEDTS